jgi:hypothetical protein
MILILPLYYYIFMKIIFDTFYYLKEFKNNLLYLILFLILSFFVMYSVGHLNGFCIDFLF